MKANGNLDSKILYKLFKLHSFQSKEFHNLTLTFQPQHSNTHEHRQQYPFNHIAKALSQSETKTNGNPDSKTSFSFLYFISAIKKLILKTKQ